VHPRKTNLIICFGKSGKILENIPNLRLLTTLCALGENLCELCVSIFSRSHELNKLSQNHSPKLSQKNPDSSAAFPMNQDLSFFEIRRGTKLKQSLESRLQAELPDNKSFSA
jgi:hypothetical protein